MTGRYGNRSGGRGGQPGQGGRGRGRSTPSKPASKKTLEDFFFYVGSSKQASDYEITAEFVVNHIKKTFDRGNDVAEALRTLVKADTSPWRPTLKTSTEPDDQARARENKQLEFEYKAELDEAMRRTRTYTNNTYKAYALLWERCAKAMQNKIASRSDYENEVYNDPIKLLKAIKEHSLNYQETRYEMSIISDAYRAVWNAKQREGESLQDYTRRFKTSAEILESHIGGPMILVKYVKTMKGYDVADAPKADKMIKQAHEALLAFLYLENSDQEKYGQIIQNLNSQKSLGNDQYPKSITETNNVLSNHKFDSTRVKKEKHYQKAPPKQKEAPQEEEEAVPLSFAQMEGKCYCCGMKGHRSPECKLKNVTPKEDWAMDKAQQHWQSQTDDDAESTSGSIVSSSRSVSSQQEKVVGWAGLHCSFAQNRSMKNLILLDSDSTDTVFCNPKYVTNIRESDEPLSISTNGGLMESHLKCDIPHISNVWYNENSMTNIISLKDMTKKFRVTMDSTKELALLVHMPDKIVKFKQFSNGLYAMDPSDETSFSRKMYTEV